MVATGDFAEFYAGAFRPLCLQLYAYTGDLGEAQDVVQEAFCRAFVRWSKLSEYDDPVAWVRHVAWNLATSRWRRLRRLVEFSGHHREELVPAPDLVGVDLRRALAKLPMQQRQAVVLHYVGGMSLADIAALTGVAEGTVKSGFTVPGPHSRSYSAMTTTWRHVQRRCAMPERQDWLGTAFDQMCRSAETRIKPAGPHAVRETVRRRRLRRLYAGGAAALLGLLIGAITVSASPGDVPLDRSTPSPRISSPQPSPEPSLSPGTVAGAPERTAPTGGQAKPTDPWCVMKGQVTFISDSSGSVVRLKADANPPMCPDGRAPILFATYTVDADGTHRLYRSQKHYLTYANPEVYIDIAANLPMIGCGGQAYYFVPDDVPILDTVPRALDAHSYRSPPYANQKVSWSVEFPCPPSPSPN